MAKEKKHIHQPSVCMMCGHSSPTYDKLVEHYREKHQGKLGFPSGAPDYPYKDS